MYFPRSVYFHSVAKFFAETTSAIVRSSDTFKATTRLVYTRSLTFFGRFHLKPLFWENSPRMEGHDLDQPGDWYPAVAARSRRYLVSTSIAKQPEREIRPVISVSLLLHPFLRRFSFTLLFFPLSLSLSFASPPSLIFTGNPERPGIIRAEGDSKPDPKSYFRDQIFLDRSVHSNAGRLFRFPLTKRKRLVYDTNRLILTRINRARFPTVTTLLCTREEKPWREINVCLRTRDNWRSGDIRLKSIEVNLEACLFTFTLEREKTQKVSSKFLCSYNS